jgi:hypothetical protein
MSERVQVKREHSKSGEAVESADKLPHAEHKSAEDLKAEMDSVLDSIDEALEEAGLSTAAEAQAQIEGFIQKGGE